MTFTWLPRNLSASFSRWLLLVLALCGVQSVAAQSLSFSSAATTLISDFTTSNYGPQAIAVDKAGNAYVTDVGAGQVIKITPSGVRSVVSTGSYTLNQPWGVTVDGSGNIYIADTGNSRIVEVAANGTASLFNTGSVTLAYPVSIAVDTAGNVYIDEYFSGRYIKVTQGGVASIVNTGSYKIQYGVGLAVDQSGTLYIIDTTYDLNASDPNASLGRIIKVTADGTASVLPLISSAGDPVKLNQPFGIALDQQGDIFIADTFDGHIVKVAPDGIASIVSTGNEGSYDYLAVASTPDGVLYILEIPSDPDSNLTEQVVVAQTESVGFGLVNVCQPGQKTPSPCSKTMTLSFVSADPVPQGTAQTLTQGVASPEFSTPATSTCEPFEGGYRCNQDVTFTPFAPGSRLGAFTLTDGNGNTISMPISGIGQAPIVAFLPGTASLMSAGNQVLSGPAGIALDYAGNHYIADSVKNQVVKIATDGTAAVLPVTTNLNQPNSIVLDGAGNLYIANTGNNNVVAVKTNGTSSALNTQSLGLSQPHGLAVDDPGNIYIADTGNNRIVVVKANGNASTLATGSLTLQEPYGVAADALGNLYIADTGNSRIVRVAKDGTASLAATGDLTLGQPAALAVDAAGTLYISDLSNHNVVAVTASGSASVVNPGNITLASPSGLTLDAAGNLYIADGTSGHVVVLNRSTPPSLNFAPTPVGASSAAQTATLANVGNSSLTLPVPSTGNNPSISANFTLGDDSACSLIRSGSAANGSLGAGSACTLNVTFTPTSMGTVRGSLIVTDDALNALNPYAAQVIPLNGSSNSEISKVTIGSSLNPSTYGQAVTFTASMSATAAGGTITFYDGATVLGTANLSASGQATFTLSTLKAGTHSITAHYPGNGTLEATTSAVLSQVVVPASAVITWTPASTITLGTNLSGVLTAKANVNGTFSYTAQATGGTAMAVTSATVLPAGKYTLTATFTPSDAADYKTATQSASLTVSTAAPGASFTLSLDTTTLTLKQAQSGIVKATFTPLNGFKGTVTLSCANLPELTNCSFNPITLTADGSNTQQISNITVSSVNAYASLEKPQQEPTYPTLAGFWFLPAGILGGLLFWQRRKLHSASKYLWMLVLLISCTMGMMGCGVNFTPALSGSGVITVTATANNGMSQATTFTLSVVRQ